MLAYTPPPQQEHHKVPLSVAFISGEALLQEAIHTETPSTTRYEVWKQTDGRRSLKRTARKATPLGVFFFSNHSPPQLAVLVRESELQSLQSLLQKTLATLTTKCIRPAPVPVQ